MLKEEMNDRLQSVVLFHECKTNKRFIAPSKYL